MKKIVTVYCILSLIFIQPVSAQELLIEAPLPEIEPPTITEQVLAEHSEVFFELETLATESANTPSPELTSSLVPATTATTAAETTSDNETETQQDLIIENVTGDNTLIASDSAELTTGESHAQATITNEQNTVIIGTDTEYGVDTIASESSDINLASIEKNCVDTYTPPSEKITISNDAQIANDIQIEASSGENSLTAPTGQMTTGAATAETAVANIANTSLVGNCWFYRVINVFTPTESTIILPNDEQFIAALSSINSPGYSSSAITQHATVTEHISHQTDTGNNTTTSQSVQTGTASSSTETTTIANTSLYGNSWLLLKITNPQYWQGRLGNSLVPLHQDETGLYLWWSIPSSSSLLSNSQGTDVSITNNANVENTIALAANTGKNNVLGSNTSLTTGSAHTEAEVLNLLNTSIIGNNWYFVLLNLFDDFSGEVRFARPDLSVTVPNHAFVQSGETLHFSATVYNAGESSGKSVTLTQYSPWNANGSTESWHINALASGNTTSIPITVTIPANTPSGNYHVSYRVSNEFTETSLNNNQTTFVISVQSPIGGTTSNTLAEKVTASQSNTYSAPISLPHITRNSYYQPTFPTQQNVLGTTTQQQESSPAVFIAFPALFSGAFCVRNWELCSAAGLLVVAGPLQAIEKRRRKKIIR